MILRSQLRMNKNIVFPFISCVMIMLTLLVLIHKSADELSAAKKEITVCKQQHDSLYTQLQSAIEYKLRLEKSLQNEKTDTKQKIEEMQALLTQEKEERRKEKDEGDNRFDALNQRFSLKETENNDVNEENKKLRKQLLDKEEENSKLDAKLKASRHESEQFLLAKNRIIEDLEQKLRKYENVPMPLKKVTPETNENLLQQGEAIQTNPNATTPKINPQAIIDEDRLVAPLPALQPPNEEPENALQKQMRKDLNPRPGSDQKPEENVMKAPESKAEAKQAQLEMSDGYDKKSDLDADKNSANMFIPKPNLGQPAKPVQPSVASNNVAELPHVDDAQQVLPMPNQNVANDKGKEIPRQIKDYAGPDYNIGEEDGEEAEYLDNEIRKSPPKKSDLYLKEKPQEELMDNGESVMVHPI